MKKSKVTYKEAFKEKLGIFIIMWILLLGVVWYAMPLESYTQLISLIVLLVLFGGLMIYSLRKAANKVFCEECGVNLYGIIERAEMDKVKVKYCPNCGATTST